MNGDNIVITVPGDDGKQARSLGQTARLFIRPVKTSAPAVEQKSKPRKDFSTMTADSEPQRSRSSVRCGRRPRSGREPG